jgi:hypothetical protein
MAIIDLGKVSITWRGTYAGGTAYTPKDAVVYNNASYICITNTTGNLPTDTTYWNVMAAKGVDGSDGTDLTSTLTTQGDILYRDGSGLQRLAAGTAGQVLQTGGSGANVSWGAGFDGNYKLHHVERYSYTGSVISVGSVSGGTADGQKDCIVINGGNYLTITPAHADDYFRFEAGVNMYYPSNNSYGGLGFMTSTDTNFSANRNFFFRSGQHSMGNGGGGGDEYNFEWIHWAGKCSEIGLSAGTTYYVRTHGQKHSTSNTLMFCGAQGTGTDQKHYMAVQHWKKQT